MPTEFEPVTYNEGNAETLVVLTCEHASNRLPPGWMWPDKDKRLIATHWASDLGAKDLAQSLAAQMEAPSVLAGFTRLFADPNRTVTSKTLFLTEADGEPIELNAGISTEERDRRLECCYQPYHQAIDRVLEAYPKARTVLSVHTFTPVYEGKTRDVGVGVLYEFDKEVAEKVVAALQPLEVPIRLNQPYSGKDRFIYSASLHAQRWGRQAVEIEVRQDLVSNPDFSRTLIQALHHCFNQ